MSSVVLCDKLGQVNVSGRQLLKSIYCTFSRFPGLPKVVIVAAAAAAAAAAVADCRGSGSGSLTGLVLVADHSFKECSPLSWVRFPSAWYWMAGEGEHDLR